jgi:hypothetical protein
VVWLDVLPDLQVLAILAKKSLRFSLKGTIVNKALRLGMGVGARNQSFWR